MQKHGLPVLLVLGLVAPASAQKQWASAAEYELYQRAQREAEPARQIELLLEWETAHPGSEFHRERLTTLMVVYKRAGRPADAFARATQLLKLDSGDLPGQYMIATLAPSLQAPSPGQVRITEEAATNLLSRAPEVGRLATAAIQAAATTPVPQPRDPEAERVAAFIRELRRAKSMRSSADVEVEMKTVAERALAWVRSTPK